MQSDDKRLREMQDCIQERSDSDLLEILNSKPGDWTPEAISFAESEVQARPHLYEIWEQQRTEKLEREKQEREQEEQAQQQSPSGQTTACPFCSEQILATAQKCKHCKEFLNPALRTAIAYSSPAAPQVIRTAKSRGIYIILGLFLGGLFGVHNFYAGRYVPAVAQLFIMLILGWFIIGIVINTIWVLIEMCSVTTDGNGNPMT